MFYRLFAKVPNYDTKIRRTANNNPLPAINDYAEGGCGPLNAYPLKYIRGSDGYAESVNNADSYACYAAVKTFSWNCQKAFGPVFTRQDYYIRLENYYLQHPELRPPQRRSEKAVASEDDNSDDFPAPYNRCIYDSEFDVLIC